MKILTSILKLFIKFLIYPFKKNKYLKKYLFDIALKKELDGYIDNGYYTGFEHIYKSIKIGKKLISDISEPIIVDIGGSIGFTAELFSKNFPKTDIYVFEPIADNYKLLSVISSKNPKIKSIHKALGNEVKDSEINIAKRISASSLFELNSNEKFPVFAENLKSERKEKIQLSKLDIEIPINKNILILKIDVQGFEIEVLKGALEVLKRTSIVTLEMNNHNGYIGSPKYFDIDQFLRNSGFVLFDILPSTKSNDQLVEWDCIYISATKI